MPPRQTPPDWTKRIWLVSDARNDRRLERTLHSLPRGSGLIFRHYHLPARQRIARFLTLRRICRARGHLAVLAGSARAARKAGADGCYGAPATVAAGPALLRLVSAHDLGELASAARARAAAVLLSPVFPTRTHPGAATLGPVRFLLMARRSPIGVIALGGMSARVARRMPGTAWAAIDGAVEPPSHGIFADS